MIHDLCISWSRANGRREVGIYYTKRARLSAVYTNRLQSHSELDETSRVSSTPVLVLSIPSLAELIVPSVEPELTVPSAHPWSLRLRLPLPLLSRTEGVESRHLRTHHSPPSVPASCVASQLRLQLGPEAARRHEPLDARLLRLELLGRLLRRVGLVHLVWLERGREGGGGEGSRGRGVVRSGGSARERIVVEVRGRGRRGGCRACKGKFGGDSTHARLHRLLLRRRSLLLLILRLLWWRWHRLLALGLLLLPERT